MKSVLRSLWIWFAAIALIVFWLPLLTIVRLFDRDPVRYRTGLWFRRLGRALTKVNASWRIHISGEHISDPRHPYVVVSNHQSLADIPIISLLPWEMKWIGKIELFRTPVSGWMMRLAGDIPVDRKDARSGAKMLLAAHRCLKQKCSVMFFPEGTRSPDGRVGRFTDGAFHLAIKAKVPVLPIAVEGSRACLPKKSLHFGSAAEVFVKILPPVDTSDMTPQDAEKLKTRVRHMILTQIAEWRNVQPSAVDALAHATQD